MVMCTFGWVVACINAGYHCELAGGGHYTENALRDKVAKIMKLIDPGERCCSFLSLSLFFFFLFFFPCFAFNCFLFSSFFFVIEILLSFFFFPPMLYFLLFLPHSITLNVLFLNARQWGFQYPLVQVMRKEVIPPTNT